MRLLLRKHLCVILILLVFSVLTISSALSESLTYDEIFHLEEGSHTLLYQDFTKDPYNPPLVNELAGLPQTVISTFIYTFSISSETTPHIRAFPSRMVIIILGALLLLSVYLFTRNRFGEEAALLSVAILAFEPTFLAHSHYITFDVATALFFFLFFVSVMRFSEVQDWKSTLIVGVTFGLALASRTSVLFYITGTATAILGYRVLARKRFHMTLDVLLKSATICFIGLMTVWGTYGFQEDVIILRHEDPSRVSSRIREFSQEHGILPVLGMLNTLQDRPVPLGRYISQVKNTALRGKNAGLEFFLGEFQKRQWYFLLVNTLLKVTMPFLTLFFISITSLMVNKEARERHGFIVIVTVTLIFMSFASPNRPLIRYLLPALPFVSILASRAIILRNMKYGTTVLLLLVSWHFFSSLSIYPHFISFQNVFASSHDQSQLLFSDSNMDWGQGLITLHRYIELEKPLELRLSYFGRDDASYYGFSSTTSYGSHVFEDICAFHDVSFPEHTGPSITAISISNWYDCRYFEMEEYQRENAQDIVGDSFLIF